MKMGRHDLTDGEILVSALSPAKATEIDSRLIKIAAAAAEDDIRVSMHSIKLPKPIIMRPSLGVQAMLSLPSLEFGYVEPLVSFSRNLDCYISLIGRLLPEGAPIPAEQEIPMWSQVKIDTATFVSDETELRNPLSKSLHVRRLVLARAVVGDVGIYLSNVLALFIGPGTERLKITFPNRDALSEGAPIRFSNNQFDGRGAWNTDFVMPANSRLLVAGSGFAPTLVASKAYIYTLTLFGTRLEAV
jgi:hypothetical protein